MSVQSDQGANVQPDQDDNSTDVHAQDGKTEVTVAGKSYSSLADIAQDYESLHKEFHKRNQEKSVSKEVPKDTASLEAALTELGFAKKADLDALQRKQHRENLVDSNPQLKGKGDLLEILERENPGVAIEDLIEKYGLAKKDKLRLAKSSGELMGSNERGGSDMASDLQKVKSGTMKLSEFNTKYKIQKVSGLVKQRRLQ